MRTIISNLFIITSLLSCISCTKAPSDNAHISQAITKCKLSANTDSKALQCEILPKKKVYAALEIKPDRELDEFYQMFYHIWTF